MYALYHIHKNLYNIHYLLYTKSFTVYIIQSLLNAKHKYNSIPKPSIKTIFDQGLFYHVIFTDLVQPGLFYIHLCHSFINEMKIILFLHIFKSLSHPSRKRQRTEIWREFYPPPQRVTCHIFSFSFFFDKELELVGGGSAINRKVSIQQKC